MASSARLKYKIVKCTSEDPEYPVSELQAHSSQTKGWQTARFCDFPQEMGLQFETPVHLRQVQFLSHQSKIATKIELFTALPTDGVPGRYDTAQFKRLGYLSLDSNERSQFQARELKSVYVNVSAQFLRILFHKCHVNRYNIVNQVGLIALNCLGEALGPDLSVGPPPPNPTLARQEPAALAAQAAQASAASGPAAAPAAAAPAPAARSAAPAAAASAAAAQAAATSAAQTAQAAQVAAAEQAKDAAQDASDEMRFDARTLERIRALNAAKSRAVEVEDYEEAKRCKEMLARLRQTGLLLKELEDRKRSAVQNEDYDAAKALKVEIDRLRQAIERPQALAAGTNGTSGSNGGASGSRQAPAMPDPRAQQAEDGRTSMNDWAAGHQQAETAMPRTRSAQQQPPLHQQALHAPASPQGVHMPGGPCGYASMQADPAAEVSPAPSPAHTAQMRHEAGSSRPAAPYTFAGGGSAGPGASGSPPPPAPFNGGACGGCGGGGGAPCPGREGATSPLLPAHANAGGGNHAGSAGFQQSQPSPQLSGQQADNSNHPLAGVPNVEELGQPDPLSQAFEKEAEPLVDLFGEYIARCIYSKSWSLRDAAIQKLVLDLQKGQYGSRDPRMLFEGFTTILRRMIPDKNVQVFLSSANLMQAARECLLERGPLRKADAQAALDPLMPLLVDRLGDANARVEKTARDAHLDFARCGAVGAPFTAQYLLRAPKKKTMHARVYSSRLQLLTSLIFEAGVQPDSREGIPLEPTVQLAMEWFNNPNGEVRESAVKLVAACYSRVGLSRIEKYLANLRQAQREVFDAEFEKVGSGGGNVTQPPPQTQQRSPLGGGSAPGPASGRGGRCGTAREAEEDFDGGLPPPQVPPPRGGRSAHGAGGAPPRPVEAEVYDDDDEEDFVAEFTCQFCGRQDPTFTPEALDVHYWRECPMLTQCELCQQVIEISTLRAHLMEECEVVDQAPAMARDMKPNSCPLCAERVGSGEDADWRHHLIVCGCPRNPRASARR